MAETSGNESPRTINIDYVKGNDFRVLHADGAYMAGAPSGLTISFYSERQPIPRRVVHEVSSNTLGKEITEQRVVRDALIRDVDVSLIMNLEVARNVYKTLGEVIKGVEDVITRTVTLKESK